MQGVGFSTPGGGHQGWERPKCRALIVGMSRAVCPLSCPTSYASKIICEGCLRRWSNAHRDIAG
eukprot:1608614-Pyramimonas_sp.AAC.1